MKKLRKYASVLTVIISVLVLSACEKTEQKVMYIKPSEFTEETREVLGLFDDEVQFFDIVLDETVKSETITVWVYRDGIWEENGKTSGPVDALCILRSLADIDAFQSGRFAEQNGRSKTLKFQPNFAVE